MQKLNENRDLILAFAWKNYINHGTGAVIFKSYEDREEMRYFQKSRITNSDDLKVVESNNPNFSSVIFCYFGDRDYFVMTLIGPNTPPECHEKLSEAKLFSD